MHYSTLSALASTTPPSISVPRDQTKATHSVLITTLFFFLLFLVSFYSMISSSPRTTDAQTQPNRFLFPTAPCSPLRSPPTWSSLSRLPYLRFNGWRYPDCPVAAKYLSLEEERKYFLLFFHNFRYFGLLIVL